jgi:osmotically-inducible protein OsmY
VKRSILALIVAVAVAGSSFTILALADLNQAARAKIEDDLFRKLTPSVGVFDYVAFKLDADGTVTLLGQVREQSLKQRVEQDAKKIEGVRQVRNQIEVLPSSRSDEEVRRSLYNAIYGQGSRLKKQTIPPVHIVVKNGAVILEGVVANQKELAQVNTAMKGVSGMVSVKNNVRIDPDA